MYFLQREKKPVIPQPEPQAGPRANKLVRVALLVNILCLGAAYRLQYVFEWYSQWPRKVNCWREGSLKSEPVFVNVYGAQESIPRIDAARLEIDSWTP